MSVNQYQILFFPGQTMSPDDLNLLVAELREVAAQCFYETPSYQVLSGKKQALDCAVISLVRDQSGRLLGFCSALALPVEDHGNVLHLGLTCVHPDARGMNLTHHLTSKLLLTYLWKKAPFSGTWISNCACVLSSLGNVAMYFEQLYPSPYGVAKPSSTHYTIANAIDHNYRESIAINSDARFDQEQFVFRGSVGGTVFEKNAEDSRFHHRDPALTQFYQQLLNFDDGDEALQIGRVSLMTFPKYVVRKGLVKIKSLIPKPRKAPHYAN